MNRKANPGFRILATFLVFLANACAPKQANMEGVILNIPLGGVTAWQIKSNRSGKEACKLGRSQWAVITRETFWTDLTGSGDSITTELVEVIVTDKGSCDKNKQVFLEKKVARRLQRESARATPEGTPYDPFLPIPTPTGWKK